MAYMTIFYVFVFSIIGHKEVRFLLPVFGFCVLMAGYVLVRKAKQLKGWVAKIINFAVFVELCI